MTLVSPASLAEIIRTADASRLAEVCAPGATFSLDMRAADIETLATLFASLLPAQRVGLVTAGGEGRTVVVAPAMTGSPASRKLFLITHPDGGQVTEIVAYTDDTPLDAPSIGAPKGPLRRLPVRQSTPTVPARALVTASSDTLGAEIAQALFDAGISTAWQGRRPDGPQPRDAVYVGGDLTSDPEAVVADAAAALGGPITILVNNLGPWDATPLAEATPAAWSRVIASHAGAALRAAQLVAPGMRELGWGRIVNISAVSAGTRDHGLYGYGKAMLEDLTASLAYELGPAITVNAISPGQIEESIPVMNEINPHAVAAMVHRTVTGRLVTRAEIAELVRLVCSPAFDTVTAAVIPADGGYRIPRNLA